MSGFLSGWFSSSRENENSHYTTMARDIFNGGYAKMKSLDFPDFQTLLRDGYKNAYTKLMSMHLNWYPLALYDHTRTFISSAQHFCVVPIEYFLLFYKYVTSYISKVYIFLVINLYWGVEHTILCVWLAVFLPLFRKRSSGNYQEILLQLIAGLPILMTSGCLVRLGIGLQENHLVFNKHLINPAIGILAVGLLILGSILNVVKKEIYGYGVSDLPTEERCALVLDSFKTLIHFGTIFLLTVAISVSFTLDLNNQSFTSLLSLLPLLGMIQAMNTYFAPEVEERIVSANGINEEVIAEKILENGFHVSQYLTKPFTKLKSILTCIYKHLYRLPWSYMATYISALGSIFALTYCWWYLTKDPKVLTFPFFEAVLPNLITIGKNRHWLTDNNGHLVSETATLAGSFLYYHLFREYIKASSAHIKAVPEYELPYATSPSPPKIFSPEFDLPENGMCSVVMKYGKLTCKEEEDPISNIKYPEHGECTVVVKDGNWVCKEDDKVLPETDDSENGICTVIVKDGKWMCKEGGEYSPPDEFLPKIETPANGKCTVIFENGKWLCKEETYISPDFDFPEVGMCTVMVKNGKWVCKEEDHFQSESDPPKHDVDNVKTEEPTMDKWMGIGSFVTSVTALLNTCGMGIYLFRNQLMNHQ